jgi:hypothetical protein
MIDYFFLVPIAIGIGLVGLGLLPMDDATFSGQRTERCISARMIRAEPAPSKFGLYFTNNL